MILSFFVSGMYIEITTNIGFATCIGACIDENGCDPNLFILGITQIGLTISGVGYIWAIITGILTFYNAYGTL